jgi:hypothetical protein
LVAGKKFVDANFEHWQYGPVNRQVYEFYKHYGKSRIGFDSSIDNIHIDEVDKKLVDFIVENYIGFRALTLSEMTHAEEPWKTTQQNQVISDDLIESYYRQKYFARNFQPFDLTHNHFYPVDNYSFIFDMREQDASEITKYHSYEDYKRALVESQKSFELEWQNIVLG